MKKKSLRVALCVMLVGTVLAAFVAVAADVGSQGDPLITLSYLNETFLGQILTKVDEKLATRNTALKTELESKIIETERELLLQLGGSVGDETGGTAVSFTAVNLTAGQTLYGGAGCEVMLRSGNATCFSEGKSTPGLVDTTDGKTINHGTALVQNHLYMMPDTRGVTASSDALVLVRGDYTIG